MSKGKCPGWRTMSAAQRNNARLEKVWHDAHILERERRAKGLEPNTSLDPDSYFKRLTP